MQIPEPLPIWDQWPTKIPATGCGPKRCRCWRGPSGCIATFSVRRSSSSRGINWEPPTDVLETQDAVLVLVALPGVDPDKVEIVIHNSGLSIAGERVLPQELRTATIHRLELPQGRLPERHIPPPGGRYETPRQRRRQRLPGDPAGQGASAEERAMSPPPTSIAASARGTPGQPIQSLPSDAFIVVPVRNTVLFPEIVFPITLGRPATIAAAQQAVREQRQILIVLQRQAGEGRSQGGRPLPCRHGTRTNIVRYVTTPDGNHMVICQGVQRFRITEFVEGQPFLMARGVHLAEPTPTGADIEARFIVLQQQVNEVLELLPRVPPELRQTVEATTSPGMLADLAITYLDATPAEKQDILETSDLVPRLDKVSKLLARRLEVLRLSAEIGNKTRKSSIRASARRCCASRWRPSRRSWATRAPTSGSWPTSRR